MLAANYTSVRNNLKNYCDMVFDNDETLIVTRKEDKNVVIMSLAKYTMFEKLLNNAKYLAMLEESNKELREGKVVVKTMEELEKMEE